MPPDVDRLLANARWVKALAVRLVADDAAAEDLAQETWLRALERPPRDAASGPSLRAWLRRVVERFALQRRRREESIAARERATAASEAQADVADIVAHAELHRRVVDAVLALDEPYRTTILLRFFEDEPPARIAERMGVPPKTVYTRLERALERLRAQFDVERRPGGELHAWIAPLALPLAAPTATVNVLREVLVMSGRMRIAAALLIVAGVSAVVWRSWEGRASGRNGAPAPTATPVATAAETPDAAPPLPRRDAEPPATRPVLPLSEINEIVFAGSISVAGRVVDEDAAPIEGAQLRLSLPDSTSVIDGVNHPVDEELRAHGFWDAPCSPPSMNTTSDARGRFTLRGLRTGLPYTLSVSAAGFRSESKLVPPGGWGWPNALGAGGEVRLPDVVMARGRELTVHVTDSRSADVGGAAVFSETWPPSWGTLWPDARERRGTTDARGLLSFSPERSPAIWISARAPDGREAVLVDVKVPVVDATDAAALELKVEDGEELRVRVRDGEGSPVSGLRVSVRSNVGASGTKIDRSALTDDEGVARFHGLPAGEREIWLSAAGGMPELAAESTRSLPVAAGTSDVELRFPLVHAPLPVRFVDAIDRSPVRATALLVVDAEVDGPRSGLTNGGRDVPTRGVAAIAADGTRGSILLSPPMSHPVGEDRFPREEQTARFRVVVDARDHARTWLGPFDPAKLSTTEPLELAIERGRIAKGVVVDERGAPIPGARIHEIGPGPGRACNMFTWQIPAAIRAARCDAAGGFSIGPLAAGPHELIADATGFIAKIASVSIGTEDPAPLCIELGRGATVEGEVRLEPDEDPGAFVVVLDRRGEPVPDLGTLTTGLDDEGHFAFSTLAPGDYAILALRPPTANADWFGSAMRLLQPDHPAPQVVRFSVGETTRKLALEAWRADATRQKLSVPIVDPARPGVDEARLLFVDESGLPHQQTAVVKGGQLEADLTGAKRLLVLLAEKLPESDLEGRAGSRSWYVGNAVLTADDLQRGVAPIRIRRGKLVVHVRRADGESLDEGAKLLIGFFVDPGFSVVFPELLMGNTRVMPLRRDGRVELSSMPVGRTWICAEDAAGKLRGERYVDVVENQSLEIDVDWK